MVALPTTMAITLQTIITTATLGDQLTVAGAMASRGDSIRTTERHLIFSQMKHLQRSLLRVVHPLLILLP